jgi:hypothetical protein
MGHGKAVWSWGRIIGFIITGLIVIDLIYWGILGIYVASAEAKSLDPILFGSLHIGVLVAMLASLYYLFDSENDWWDHGCDYWGQVLLFVITFTFLVLMDLFVMLKDILEPVAPSGTTRDLIVAMSAIQFTFTVFAWLWAIVMGIVVLIFREDVHQHMLARRAQHSNVAKHSQKATFSTLPRGNVLHARSAPARVVMHRAGQPQRPGF